MQVLDPAIEVCLLVPPRQPVHTGCGITLEHEERGSEHSRIEMVEERGDSNMQMSEGGALVRIQRHIKVRLTSPGIPSGQSAIWNLMW
jgi:hypothetical protein